MTIHIGILALQGDFDAHRQKLARFNLDTMLVQHPYQLEALDGLVLPGGESSAMLRLMSIELEERISSVIRAGMPVLATCAGLILIASKVLNPEQRSLSLLGVEVERNAYGRQLQSFVDPDLKLTEAAFKEPGGKDELSCEGIFIRAPKITKLEDDVSVLATQAGDPVLVKQGKILAATFHPELSAKNDLVTELFLASVNS